MPTKDGMGSPRDGEAPPAQCVSRGHSHLGEDVQGHRAASGGCDKIGTHPDDGDVSWYPPSSLLENHIIVV